MSLNFIKYLEGNNSARFIKIVITIILAIECYFLLFKNMSFLDIEVSNIALFYKDILNILLLTGTYFILFYLFKYSITMLMYTIAPKFITEMHQFSTPYANSRLNCLLGCLLMVYAYPCAADESIDSMTRIVYVIISIGGLCFFAIGLLVKDEVEKNQTKNSKLTL